MKLFYKKIGDGPPFIFMHGLLGSCDNWYSLGERFQDKYTIYLPDMRNHGQSPYSDTHDYPSIVADLHEFIHDHNLNEVILFGHSMGGKAVMRYAIDYPERVSRIIIADIAPKIYKSKNRYLLEMLSKIDLSTIKNDEDADKLLHNKVKNLLVRQVILKNLIKKDDLYYKWKINLDSLYKNLVSIRGSFSPDEKFYKPTLFLDAERSNYILPSDHELIKSIFNDVQIVCIPKADHWLYADNSDFVYEVIEKFISGKLAENNELKEHQLN